MANKEALKQKFSSDPTRYYQVELFTKLGFKRKRCKTCGSHFWTLNTSRENCPQQPCEQYGFLGSPPTSRRLDYVETWRQIERFFVENGHTSVKRYPVVCRWRPDLFFTVASIIDFQRVEGGKVVFELPANPLIVPQLCLRFNDIPNVGVTGRHFTSFCMVGQHSIANSEGYWKDRCIELDYRLLTGPFGIEPEEIVFVEDVWLGYGAFGYSLEYYVRGLELGNAVFTEFEGTPESYREMEEKVVDMGAGLERFVWLTQGTSTSYECVFGPVVRKIIEECKVDHDPEFLLRYASYASNLDFSKIPDVTQEKVKIAERLGMSYELLKSRTEAVEAVYAISDHVRTLVFAITDGGLPSNVGGGYNLRVVLRRALDLLRRFRWNLRLSDVALWHIDYLREMYPELEEHREEVVKILDVEEKRYEATKARAGKLVQSLLKSRRALSEDELIELYDSHGITPDFLASQGFTVPIPSDFYSKVSARHLTQKEEGEVIRFDVRGLPKTNLLFYEDERLTEFEAKVLRVFENRYVVLDKTAFYARAGGQEPDLGYIDGCKVVDVQKYGNVVVHEVEGCSLREGQMVKAKIDERRRSILMRHHTATHVVNGAARKVLGSWVWQHSAFKAVDFARLDITHYAHLTKEELERIEDLANQIVLKNLPVVKEVLKRGEAEQRYGFRIYQGGVVPSRDVRIVNILGWDVEACGGTHCDSTGEIGLIKLLKSERVQDGVERIEFVAGEAALKHVRKQEGLVKGLAESLQAQEEKLVDVVHNLKGQLEAYRSSRRALIRRLAELEARFISENTVEIEGVRIYVSPEDGLDDEYHIGVGQKSIELEPRLVYCGFTLQEKAVRLYVFSGTEARSRAINAGELAKTLAKILGGSGGGDKRFGQGGGPLRDKLREAKSSILSLIQEMMGSPS